MAKKPKKSEQSSPIIPAGPSADDGLEEEVVKPNRKLLDLLAESDDELGGSDDDEEPNEGPKLAKLALPMTDQKVTVLESAAEKAPSLTPVSEVPMVQIDAKNLLDDFETQHTEILEAWRSDRKQVQELIKDFQDRLDPPADAPPLAVTDRQTYVNAISNLAATKVTSSMVAVKALEAKTRLIGALRNALLVAPTGNQQMSLDDLAGDTVVEDA